MTDPMAISARRGRAWFRGMVARVAARAHLIDPMQPACPADTTRVSELLVALVTVRVLAESMRRLGRQAGETAQVARALALALKHKEDRAADDVTYATKQMEDLR